MTLSENNLSNLLNDFFMRNLVTRSLKFDLSICKLVRFVYKLKWYQANTGQNKALVIYRRKTFSNILCLIILETY